MNDIDKNPWRADFPIFDTEMNGKPLVYLDTASSAQKPRAVIEKMTALMNSGYSNVHRGLYKISQELSEKFEQTRSKIKEFLNIPEGYDVIFTRNSTEAINLVAQSYGGAFLQAEDEILLTEMEHHANIVPWHFLRERQGAVLRFAPITQEGALDLAGLAALLSPQTRIVSLVHVSNALGTVNPVEEVIRLVRRFNPDIKILIDGSQAVVHGSVDLSSLRSDFYVFTGHKLYGPSGVGVLIARHDLLEAMPPYQGGGDMIETVHQEVVTYKPAPHKFEAGTPAILEVIGLGAAIDYVSSLDRAAVFVHERALLSYATEQIKLIDGIKIYGQAPEKAGIISFITEWAHGADIAMILDQCGVAVRVGHHCCMPLMQRYGLEGTVRASFGLYNTKNDIDRLMEGLQKAKRLLE
ncbi:MAG: SufS family cysteine desulfurase [Rhodospirillales bacterium]|nr:SufS family cysteine desulfurase [Rhodospirillales bacterium]